MKVHELFAYLHVRDAAKAIEFYKQAFGAEEKFRLNEPSGRIGHAELVFAGTTVMLSDEFPEYGIRGPGTDGATSISIHLHVDDADEVMRRAAAAGATIERPAEDHFYGERSGVLRDPFGHRWNIGHHIEDVSFDEMQRRYTKMMS
ncbi:MAG TPA: VOC family protein [Candidatus Binatia bacterium]|nr:VOC family protein [Candidatus Binatia bacterium]